MKRFTYTDKPVEVHGIARFEERGQTLERVPKETRDAVFIEPLRYLGKRSSGARVMFRTNSTKINFHIELEPFQADIGMALFAAQSAHVFVGERSDAEYACLLTSSDYTKTVADKTLEKSDKMEDIMVWLPLGSAIVDFYFEIEDDAEIEAPTPYKYPPMLFYGSSITEGAHSSRPANSYSAILSNHLDVDYYNLGFSGSAKGEPEMADYINTIDMSIFVLDYDHNAPDVEHLERTHEPFFMRIREKNPDLPIIMLTRPNCDYDKTADDRRAVVRRTYENALSRGDKNVYFVSGKTFFGDKDRHLCTTDRTHPNDIGAYRMALTLEPLVKEILEKRYGK